MTDRVHVVAVTDEFSGFDALYVGGELKIECDNLFPCDIAQYTKGMLIDFSHISVQMPEDEQHYPHYFDKCMLWNPVASQQ